MPARCETVYIYPIYASLSIMSPLSLLRSIVNSPSVSNLLITWALQSRHILVNIFCSHSRLITSFLWYGDETVRNTVSSAWPTFFTTVTWCPNSLLTQTMNASKPYAFFTTHLPALLLSGKHVLVSQGVCSTTLPGPCHLLYMSCSGLSSKNASLRTGQS